jgi:hypothetical protein
MLKNLRATGFGIKEAGAPIYNHNISIDKKNQERTPQHQQSRIPTYSDA